MVYLGLRGRSHPHVGFDAALDGGQFLPVVSLRPFAVRVGFPFVTVSDQSPVVSSA